MHVDLARIEKARLVLKENLQPTPLILNPWLSEVLGCELYLKLETMTPIGAFKIRGATFKISQLTPEERKRGVITASAGNHAQGVAWGSQRLGVDAWIVMPKGAPLVKVQNTQSLGARVILEGDNYDEAFVVAQELATKTQRVFVPAFEDADIIAGQGTVGLEIVDQLKERGVSCDFVVGAVGGGGLMAGVGIALQARSPGTQLIACQAEGAASMVRSIEAHHAVTLERARTFADGISVKKASEPMRVLLEKVVHRWTTVTDGEIATSVVTLLEKAKVLAEGSAAAGLAAIRKLKDEVRGKRVVLLVSGGNMDINLLSRVIDAGLSLSGRRLRLKVLLSDKPGQLAKLTQLLGELGANILQAMHDRGEPSTSLDQVEVLFTLETRGVEHGEDIFKALKPHVAHVARLDGQ